MFNDALKLLDIALADLHQLFVGHQHELPIFKGDVDITHLSPSSSTLKNKTGAQLVWKASFYGQHERIKVNGDQVPARTEITKGGEVISFIEVAIRNNEEVKVALD